MAQKKAAAKAAKELLKAAKADNAEVRFTWSKEASLELLGFVQMIKEDHAELSKRPGFVSFSKFVLVNHDRKGLYTLLDEIANDTILRWYRALMNVFRVSD